MIRIIFIAKGLEVTIEVEKRQFIDEIIDSIHSDSEWDEWRKCTRFLEEIMYALGNKCACNEDLDEMKEIINRVIKQIKV